MERTFQSPGDPHGSPDRVRLNRRRLLKATGTLAVGTALSGCLGGFGGGSASVGERPAYSRWIGAEHLETATAERDGLLFLRTGFREVRELQGTEDSFGDFGDGLANDDAYQLAFAPLWGTVAFVFVASLGLFAYGDAATPVLVAMREGMGGNSTAAGAGTTTGTGTPTETGSGGPHTVDSGALVGKLVVFEGDFDVDALDASLETFEVAEEYGGFRIYEGTGEGGSPIDTDDRAFAVGDGAVLFPFPTSDPKRSEGWNALDSTAVIKSHIDVAVGDAEEAADAYGDFDWTLRAGGGLPFVIGGYGLTDTDIDRTEGTSTDGPRLDEIDSLVADAGSFALSMDWDVDRGAIVADGAFAYPDEASRPDEAAFEDLTDEATTSSVTVDPTRARVEAEWTGGGPESPSA